MRHAPRGRREPRQRAAARNSPRCPDSLTNTSKPAVKPKHNISDPGPETVAISAKPIRAGEIRSTVIDPNFRNFVETPDTDFVSGMWTVLGTWTSSVGDNLVNGYGLRVASQGSQLFIKTTSPPATCASKS